ncbi:MAG: ABC transporter ATP-binding protein [Miniphocaeibacter sp.]|uniref:ABC transporter ATP-binding protein n=1 Tax=Miniphocaeibacter sp. TaxID=3100973 RepID=UPI001821F897|nr:ABC transporter ATP-binding protein [Gallicola sp.]
MEQNCHIQFKHVDKFYGENKLIQDLNFCIEKGEFVTLIGSSGSGKTTILKMINGLIPINSGEIFINNKNIANENMIMLRRNIGYAIQGSALFPHMTVEKNISYVPNLLNKRDKERTKKTVKKWMDIVGLEEEMLSRYPNELSGGQQQRVGIARALAANPEILLMDEPFGAVDEITRRQLQDEIKRIHKETGITIVFVTHDIREALSLGTKIMILQEGDIVQYDTPENIKENQQNPYIKDLLGEYIDFE